MPLEKLPLNCDGLPLIVENINDYINDKGIYVDQQLLLITNLILILIFDCLILENLLSLGLYEEFLFDEAYALNERKANIINAYELVSGSRKNFKTILDIDAVDVASVLVMWLYYLPKPLISSKQFSMICGNLLITVSLEGTRLICYIYHIQQFNKNHNIILGVLLRYLY